MIRKCYRTSIRLGYCISIPATFIFLAFPETILSFFVNEAATIEIGSAYLRIVGFSQLFATLETLTSELIPDRAYQISGNREHRVHHNEDTSCPSAWQKSGNGNRGVWWSISLTSVIKGIVLYLLYRKGKRNLKNQTYNIAVYEYTGFCFILKQNTICLERVFRT